MQLTLDEIKGLVKINRLDHRKENAYGLCPECGQDEFGISLSNNHRFGCFRKKRCGFNGNIFTLLRYLGKQIIDVKPGFAPRQRLEDKITLDSVDLDLSLEDVAMPLGWTRIRDHWYLNQRGFTKEDYERFPVGVTNIDSRFRDKVIFRIDQNGTTKAYIGRSTKSKKEIERINEKYKAEGKEYKYLRYKNSEDTDFSKVLLGIEEITENTTIIILVEGLFDKVNTDHVLQLTEQEEIKCCCTFKCGASPEQIFLMQQSGIDTIILLYDPDVIKDIKKASWELEKYFNVFVGYEENGRDPGDMIEEDFDEVFDNLKTPSQFDVSKMVVPELKKK